MLWDFGFVRRLIATDVMSLSVLHYRHGCVRANSMKSRCQMKIDPSTQHRPPIVALHPSTTLSTSVGQPSSVFSIFVMELVSIPSTVTNEPVTILLTVFVCYSRIRLFCIFQLALREFSICPTDPIGCSMFLHPSRYSSQNSNFPLVPTVLRIHRLLLNVIISNQQLHTPSTFDFIIRLDQC